MRTLLEFRTSFRVYINFFLSLLITLFSLSLYVTVPLCLKVSMSLCLWRVQPRLTELTLLTRNCLPPPSFKVYRNLFLSLLITLFSPLLYLTVSMCPKVPFTLCLWRAGSRLTELTLLTSNSLPPSFSRLD